MQNVWLLRILHITSQQPDVPHIPTALYSLYICNVAPVHGLQSPKHVEHPKIKTSYKNLCILLVHFHKNNNIKVETNFVRMRITTVFSDILPNCRHNRSYVIKHCKFNESITWYGNYIYGLLTPLWLVFWLCPVRISASWSVNLTNVTDAFPQTLKSNSRALSELGCSLLLPVSSPWRNSPPADPGPHYQGFTITLRHTTLGITPLDEWWARHRDLTTHKTHYRQTSLHSGGIRTRNPSKRAAAEPRLRPYGHRDRPFPSIIFPLYHLSCSTTYLFNLIYRQCR